MILDGPSVLPQSDCHHLAEAALDVSIEVRVWLDSVHHHNVVSFQRVVVKKHRDPLGRLTNLGCFHRRPYRRTHAAFCDPIVLQNQPLPFRSSAAMTTHGRNDEWADTEFLKLINYGTNDDRNVSHAAAATGNRH